MSAYLASKPRQRKSLWIMNPNKLAAVELLVLFWELRGHKIIVFSDDLTTVQLYSSHLGRQCMTGAVLPLASSFKAPSKLPACACAPCRKNQKEGVGGEKGGMVHAVSSATDCSSACVTHCVPRGGRCMAMYANAERRACARGAAVQIPRRRV